MEGLAKYVYNYCAEMGTVADGLGVNPGLKATVAILAQVIFVPEVARYRVRFLLPC